MFEREDTVNSNGHFKLPLQLFQYQVSCLDAHTEHLGSFLASLSFEYFLIML